MPEGREGEDKGPQQAHEVGQAHQQSNASRTVGA
eukprot:CAMPEP_0119116200 /NCGR_PEP_ID=MMETSP1180-20130426/52155_1 /TAXON_ID=3052 ORGANISM="Chlamydomonas cf sp, Strain CCMP681" /NCGR_SAMPLE_ID=MMETSP1180 /ASSEMBLY_ACC=CAM_ASM_000741 /LENGTH=33 /DNA_ID= /DNA_START= /DNA_END= /DNA_ORIENTATION=